MGIIKGFFRNLYLGLVSPPEILHKNYSLFIMLVRRDLVGRTSGTVLGKLWPVIQPSFQVLGFWFLFDIVYGMRLNRGPSFLEYLLVGILPWLCVGEVLSRASGMFREFGALFHRSPFPIEILPFVNLAIPCLVYTIVYFLMCLGLYGLHSALFALFVIPVLLLWLFPIALLFSLLGLFIRDFAQAVPFLLMVLMYTAPILYFPNMLPEGVQAFMWLNPFSDLLAIIHSLIQGQDHQMTAMNIIRPLCWWVILLGPAWAALRRSLPHVREVL